MTAKSHTKRHDLLKALLAPLLEEWGRDAVLACIAEHNAGLVSPASARGTKPEGGSTASSRKPSATDIAYRAELPAAKRTVLLSLASLFDQKLFLPSASDARHFLELRGRAPRAIKQRLDAFREVLSLLSELTEEELDRLVKNSAHSGPTQLGPLSDAIRATGSAIRSVEPPDDGHLDGTESESNISVDAPREHTKKIE